MVLDYAPSVLSIRKTELRAVVLMSTFNHPSSDISTLILVLVDFEVSMMSPQTDTRNMVMIPIDMENTETIL
jgi:hypothetical protein